MRAGQLHATAAAAASAGRRPAGAAEHLPQRRQAEAPAAAGRPRAPRGRAHILRNSNGDTSAGHYRHGCPLTHHTREYLFISRHHKWLQQL